jgi:hypothetical protein
MWAVLPSGLSAQSVADHPATWFEEPDRVFFYRLDKTGDRLFVNRSTASGNEALVEVPSAGGATVVWHESAGRAIAERFAVSGDGDTVAFAKASGSSVTVLTSPTATPVTAANVAPDRDPRQLVLSRDGQWVAFTAAGVTGGALIGTVKVNLYVAATNGSVVHTITSSPLRGKFIPFALSADGSTLVWVDDPMKGPIVCDRDGTDATRLPALASGIHQVDCAPDGSVVYSTRAEASGIELRKIPRVGSTWTVVDSVTGGIFTVTAETGAVRLVQQPSRDNPGACWSVTAPSTRSEMFTFETPRHAGSLAISGDGEVAVWREGPKTRVWRATP